MHGILRVKGMLSIKYEDWRVLRRHNRLQDTRSTTGDPSLLRWSLAARCPHAVIGSLMIYPHASSSLQYVPPTSYIIFPAVCYSQKIMILNKR